MTYPASGSCALWHGVMINLHVTVTSLFPHMSTNRA
jgi:hypothetical protein